MKYLSVCSGIEAASVAFRPLGWEPVAFSEIDVFPSAVLKHRFPETPNWGDMTKYEEWPDECRCSSDRLHESDRQTGSSLAGDRPARGSDVHADKGTPSRSGNHSICPACGGLNEPITLICGGTPCQSFSIAGLRKGLDDERGNLMLTFGLILSKYRPSWFIWENVPGVLSSDDGRDFASFLGLVTGQVIEPPREGWQNTGCLSGIDSAYGIAYRVLDAQYTRSPNYPWAVPQRRRRVFVVGHLGDWRRAAAVLLDSESVSGHPSPGREAGQRVAGTLKGGSGERGYPDPSDGNGGGLIGVAPTLTGSGRGVARTGESRGQDPVIAVFDNHPQDSRITEMDGVCSTVHSKYGTGGGNVPLVAHTLSADGFDASEDGTGRGVPIIADTIIASQHKGPGHNRDHNLIVEPIAIQGTIIGRGDGAGPQGSGTSEDGAMFTLTKTDQHAVVAIRTANTNANGHGVADEVAHTLDGANGQAIAFSCKDSGGDAVSEVAPTLRAMGHSGSHPNAGGQMAVAFQQNTRDEVRLMNGDGHIAGCISAESGMKQQNYIADQMAVRRLIPSECEKLQGFEPGHTNVPYRGKTTSPDGPRYKAIGNSMATNVMELIGIRIQQVNDLFADKTQGDQP